MKILIKFLIWGRFYFWNMAINNFFFFRQVVYSHTGKVGTQAVNPPKQEEKQEEEDDDDFNIDDI